MLKVADWILGTISLSFEPTYRRAYVHVLTAVSAVLFCLVVR